MNAYLLMGLLLIGSVLFAWFSFSGNPAATEETSTTTPRSTQEDELEEQLREGEETADPALDLSLQNLTAVDDEVFSRTELTLLDLSNNNLSGSLQGEIRFLQNLKTLDLSDNNWTGVPAEIGQLEKLEVLDLSNNPITGLPHELGSLQNLQLLDLRSTNYSKDDLEIIKKTLPASTVIRTE
jgi:Leucine-rich repeat (LRR) protein